MLCNPHKFYMSIAHLFHISCQSMSQFPVIVESRVILSMGRMSFPGAGMHLINRHGIFSRVELQTFLQPGCIPPPKWLCQIRNSGRIPRAHFRVISVWVCLIQQTVIISGNTVFVQVPILHPWNKQLINSHIIVAFHFISLWIPVIKIPNNRHTLCPWCPYSKKHTFFFSLSTRMCPKQLINFIMCSLTK